MRRLNFSFPPQIGNMRCKSRQVDLLLLALCSVTEHHNNTPEMAQFRMLPDPSQDRDQRQRQRTGVFVPHGIVGVDSKADSSALLAAWRGCEGVGMTKFARRTAGGGCPHIVICNTRYSLLIRAASNSSPFCQPMRRGELAASQPRAKPKRAMAASPMKSISGWYSSLGWW